MIPPWYDATSEKSKVCRLKKTLYRLKQPPHARFGTYTKTMMSLGYEQSQDDYTLFFKHRLGGKIICLLVYVDDIFISGDYLVEN